MFYKISFRQSDLEKDADIWSAEEIESIQFEGKMIEAGRNGKSIYFDDVITINSEIIKDGYTVIVN